MHKKIIKYSVATTVFLFDASLQQLSGIVDKASTFIITDDNLFHFYQKSLKGWKVILVHPGEKYKNQETVDRIILQLIEQGADRSSTIVGLGGGVVTDMAGYVASIYMRGVSFGFIPSSILGMVDAAIGGKNGVDVGVYKNMIGNIRQPAFLLYDYSLLKTLPQEEWVNGFAEIIKHAAIKDVTMFRELQKETLKDYQHNKDILAKLIQRNALLKARIVQQDEFEGGNRKLLNFGHTLGHAIENTYQLPHGHAVAIGMVFAAYLSKELLDFKCAEKLVTLLQQYELPTFFNYDRSDALVKMLADKKRVSTNIHYVLLQKLGQAQYLSLEIEKVALLMEVLAEKH